MEPGEKSVESEQPSPERHQFAIGGSLNWESGFADIVLCVELPFWLLMPGATLPVTIGEFTTEVIVDNTGIEIQRGRQYSRTHQNIMFIGGRQAAKEAQVPVIALPYGGVIRTTRTLLYIKTFALGDALDALLGPDNRRFQDGYRYFISLAIGHLKVVNEVINAYRRAAVDPFANEVTAWDIPMWYVCTPSEMRPICLCSHLAEDGFPTYHPSFGSDDELPRIAATDDEVAFQLGIDVTPGESEMLDGWSLFYRGRYGDSIRSFVTAIEVLLESEMRRLLAASGETPKAIDLRLDATRNNFDSRLDDYCRLSGRRVPGPILHGVPYINGVRLAEELHRTRRLRHRIVHHGHRLDERFAKPMYRAAETTSWFFDWLTDGGNFEDRRRKSAVVFHALRMSGAEFRCEIQDKRIVVVKPSYLESDDDESSQIVRITGDHVVHSDEMLVRAISTSGHTGKDVELFVKMAFYELGAGEIADSPYATEGFDFPERFRLKWRNDDVAVFVIDTGDRISCRHVHGVLSFLSDRRAKGICFQRVVVVANDEMDREWTQRSRGIDTAVDELAKQHGISIIRTNDLAKVVLGSMKYDWSQEKIVETLLTAGTHGTHPPAATLIGHVYRYWEKVSVLGIQSLAAVPVVLQPGQVFAIELRDGFHQHRISEMKIDELGRITIKVDLRKGNTASGSPVYLIDQQATFQPQSNRTSDEAMAFGPGIAIGIVHPSRYE